jgi:hypothetical protein
MTIDTTADGVSEGLPARHLEAFLERHGAKSRFGECQTQARWRCRMPHPRPSVGAQKAPSLETTHSGLSWTWRVLG